jgi:tRNA(Ile)-lysidine synthase
MPPEPLLSRFRADLVRLTGGEPRRLGVAVSGGADSLALLLLAHAAFPGEVAAATVDHGLREEAAGEAALVAGVCERLGCPHATLRVDVAVGGEGLQGEARRARYRALADWAEGEGIGWILTAHQSDDQAETILMRLQRGSGLAGLASVRAVRAEGARVRVARPLLGWSRAELEAVVEAAGLEPVQDRSNRDERFDRVRMRRFLAANPAFEPQRLARSAAALAEAEEALGWAAEAEFQARCAFDGDGCRIDPAGLPRGLRRRLLARAVAEVRTRAAMPPPPRGIEDVEGLLAAAEAGGSATLAGLLVRGGESWTVRPAPPRRQG